jgi:predicted ATPase/class 3 adenylate cyclase
MGTLPTGTVTFLFTDIEGSTRLWEQHPAAMKQALARHDEMLRQAIEGRGGYVFKTVGDSFCAAFAAAPDALEAALEAQRALQAEAWPGGIAGINVRMALHTGTAEPREDDYFGPPLNRVARLEAAAHGGQVLLSLATQELVRDSLPRGASLRDLGAHRLKDLFRPERVFQLVVPGLREDFPPLRTLDMRRTNLSAQPTPFIGRERELVEVVNLFRRDDVRLVTLTGPGGTGKTRLSLQAAADLIEEYEDGVFFVDLSALRDPALVVQTTATTLGVKPAEGTPIEESLTAFLADRHVLLVLDNFEQVVEAAKDIGSLLADAPHLKVMVSSRHILNLYGEHEYAVPPLGLPERRRRQTAAVLSQYESVALFIQRAKAAKADFEITEENAPAIAEICVRLDGLPLAIELAAARSKMLRPEAMRERLENRLKTLQGGARDVPARQRTMRGAIDWSYDLLDEGEKKLFARLGGFRGGWFLEAAEAVCGEGLNLDVFDGLESLLDKSLIREMPSQTGEMRFVMLEVLREYAAERLDESGEAEAVRERHAAHYVEIAERISGWDDEHDAHILLEEMDNFRAAINGALNAGQPDLPFQVIHAISGGLDASGFSAEALGWLNDILVRREKLAPARLAPVLRQAGNFEYQLHHFDAAQHYYEQSLLMCRESGDKDGEAASINNLAMIAGEALGDHEQALELYRQALALYREAGVRQGEDIALGNLGETSACLGRYEDALDYYEQAMQIAVEINSYPNQFWIMGCMADTLRQMGQYDRAYDLLVQTARLGGKWGVPFVYMRDWFLYVSLLAAAEQKYQRAAQVQGIVDGIQEEGRLLPVAALKEHHALKERLRAELSEEVYQAAWERGRNMSEEQAIEFGMRRE